MKNSYSALVAVPCLAAMLVVFAVMIFYNVRHDRAGQAIFEGVYACALLASLVLNFRIVWLELRKSDPHYQKP